jgi:hypothetical protein
MNEDILTPDSRLLSSYPIVILFMAFDPRGRSNNVLSNV